MEPKLTGVAFCLMLHRPVQLIVYLILLLTDTQQTDSIADSASLSCYCLTICHCLAVILLSCHCLSVCLLSGFRPAHSVSSGSVDLHLEGLQMASGEASNNRRQDSPRTLMIKANLKKVIEKEKRKVTPLGVITRASRLRGSLGLLFSHM